MISAEQQVRELRAERDKLQDRIAVLEDALGSTMRAPSCLNLTRMEERIFCCIYKRGFAERNTILGAMYGADMYDMSETSALQMHLSHIRKKIAQHGIEIKNIYARGWEMPEESRRIVRARLDAEKGAA